MKLILARHGNTFNNQNEVVWLGRKQDPLLTKKGEEQAINLANYLNNNFHIKHIYTSPLKRCQQYASIVNNNLTRKAIILTDHRLNELDYGIFAGKTNDELIKLGYKKELENWIKYGVFPDNAKWIDCQDSVEKEIKSFITDLENNFTEKDTILTISSNGKLRFFAMLDKDAFCSLKKKENLRISTGSIAILAKEHNNWNVLQWNITPFATK